MQKIDLITKVTFLGSVKSNNYMAKFYFSPCQFAKSGKGGKIVEFNLGNGLKTTNTNEMATSLLKRDYPEIASFKTGQNVAMIFVPKITFRQIQELLILSRNLKS